MANDAGGVVRPMGLLYPCQRGNTGQPGMSAFQVNGSPRAYIASSLRERTSTVHPHACGEHNIGIRVAYDQHGSSPRMWGTHFGHHRKGFYERFIPTHVGNTARVGDGARLHPVHPHACGEHDPLAAQHLERLGSSPRMWGTPERIIQHLYATRFIPTHVGNTIDVVILALDGAVHPHACGEHDNPDLPPRTIYGSSPRMWGTHRRSGRHDRARRFIPTHVGNTRSPGH